MARLYLVCPTQCRQSRRGTRRLEERRAVIIKDLPWEEILVHHLQASSGPNSRCRVDGQEGNLRNPNRRACNAIVQLIADALLASSNVLRDPGGTTTWDNGTHQQEKREGGFMVCPRAFQRPLHGVEFSFEIWLLWHKIARAGPGQLQSPNRAEEGL